MFNVLLRFWGINLSNRDFKIQRRGRQRERQKNLKKQQLRTCITLFCTFLCRFCTTTRWKLCLSSRFMEDVNKQRRKLISLPELGYGSLKFSFRRVRLHLTSKFVEIIAIKTERMQTHFLSVVLVAIASLDLKVHNISRWTPAFKEGDNINIHTPGMVFLSTNNTLTLLNC